MTVTATDGTASTTQTFNWNVVPLILSAPANQSSLTGSSVNLALPVDVASGYNPSYTATGLPPGLSISNTGVISGTLATADNGKAYAVTVSATAGGVTVTQTLTWTVASVVVTAPADQTSAEGDAVSLQLSAQTAGGTLTYNASGLPDGLSINPSTGLISGTVAPGAAANGPFSVTVVAGNGTASASQTFTWTINPLITVSAIDDQSTVEGTVVALSVSASELVSSSASGPLTYSATGLPPGLSISATGLIGGTLTAGASLNGPYSVTVTVANGSYNTQISFNWTALPGTAPAGPTLANPGTQVNVAGDSVNLPLTASDAAGYTLTFSATNLPDGLNIDPSSGTISGTIAEDAITTTPYVVTVTAADGVGETTSQTFTWLVNDPALSVQLGSWTATQGVALSSTQGVAAGSAVVATFTDTDPNWDASDFTATVSYGDGTTDTATVSGANGSFTVTGRPRVQPSGDADGSSQRDRWFWRGGDGDPVNNSSGGAVGGGR